MKMSRIVLIVALLAAAVSTAWAVQPGTTGTVKTWQNSGLRSGVLIQKNNTATAVAGAATLNAAGSGVVTTESLTTASGSDYTLTLTNSIVAAADVVLASVSKGSSTGGDPFVKAITPAAGSVTIVVRNGTGSTAFNGTLQVRFLVVKQSVTGSD